LISHFAIRCRILLGRIATSHVHFLRCVSTSIAHVLRHFSGGFRRVASGQR